MPNHLVFYGREFETTVREILRNPEGPVTDRDVSAVAALDCAAFPFHPLDIDALKRFTRLESLRISVGNRTDLAFLGAFPRLRTLSVSCCTAFGAPDLRALASLAGLETLEVSGGLFSGADLLFPASPPGLKVLTRLSLLDLGTADLAFLAHTQRLAHFSCAYTDRLLHADRLGSLRALRSLSLTDVNLQDLRFLDPLPDETSVRLFGCRVAAETDVDRLLRFSAVELRGTTVNGRSLSFRRGDPVPVGA